ncbi:hypothetical protein ABZ374_47165, partial [Embleya sp. NPDC005971]
PHPDTCETFPPHLQHPSPHHRPHTNNHWEITKAVACVHQIRGLIDAGLSTRTLRSVIPYLEGALTLPPSPGPELVALLGNELAQLDERITCLTRNRDAIRDYLTASRPSPEG